MEEVIRELIEEQKKTNDILNAILDTNKVQKDPDELLTIEQISEEKHIGINTVRNMFKDPELPVQTYTHPMKVTRGNFIKYFDVRHDELSKKKAHY